MDSKHIEALLEKYWNAETSLEEEKELHEFFGGTNMPDHLKEAAELFRSSFYGLFEYVSDRIPEISDELYRVDDAMRAFLQGHFKLPQSAMHPECAGPTH